MILDTHHDDVLVPAENQIPSINYYHTASSTKSLATTVNEGISNGFEASGGCCLAPRRVGCD